jgi:hypothetical protein
MEQVVLFEQKVYLTPKDMNRVAKEDIDSVLLDHLRTALENKCSQHGFVLPKSLEILSRSMGHLENGRFTGNILFHVQAKGKVYYPVNGTKITGVIQKKNKMGLYVVYEDAIRILVPRDLHLHSDDFESLQLGDVIQIEIRKSRFQIHDPFILSVGVYLGRAERAGEVEVPETPMPNLAPPTPREAPAPSAAPPVLSAAPALADLLADTDNEGEGEEEEDGEGEE